MWKEEGAAGVREKGFNSNTSVPSDSCRSCAGQYLCGRFRQTFPGTAHCSDPGSETCNRIRDMPAAWSHDYEESVVPPVEVVLVFAFNRPHTMKWCIICVTSFIGTTNLLVEHGQRWMCISNTLVIWLYTFYD